MSLRINRKAPPRLPHRVKVRGLYFADVAELADALDSGSSGSNTVWVQVPSSAPTSRLSGLLVIFVFRLLSTFLRLPTFIHKRFNRYFLSELHSITHIIYRQEIAITNHRHEFITAALYYA